MITSQGAKFHEPTGVAGCGFTVTSPQSWRAEAACAGLSIDVFYEAASETYAKSVCKPCPVAKECREWADATETVDGIFGGMTPRERKDAK